jgi:hypothetical protein
MKLKSASLEDPTLWRKVHNPWISEIYQALKAQVAGRLGLSIDQEITLIELEGAPRQLRADLHLTELRAEGGPAVHTQPHAGAVAYAEGLEEWSTESRHFIVLRDLSGERVVALLEIRVASHEQTTIPSSNGGSVCCPVRSATWRWTPCPWALAGCHSASRT